MPNVPQRTVDSLFNPKKARKTYDSLSGIYDYLTAYEGGAKERGLELVDVKPGQTLLEVGFGTGTMLCEIARKIGDQGCAIGIDISIKMLCRALQSLSRGGLSSFAALTVADASHLPFRYDFFDAIFSSYVLDLMAAREISLTLGEFHRVIRPGGRVVLVSLSKGKNWYSNMKLYEWLYRQSHSLLGGCRPLLLEGCVKDAGFTNIKREFLMAGHLMPSEIISCEKSC